MLVTQLTIQACYGGGEVGDVTPTLIVTPSSSSSSAIVDNLVFSSSVNASFLLPRFFVFVLQQQINFYIKESLMLRASVITFSL